MAQCKEFSKILPGETQKLKAYGVIIGKGGQTIGNSAHFGISWNIGGYQ